MRGLTVKLGARSYPIKIGRGILAEAGAYISRLGIGKNGVIVTNPKIKALYGAALKKSLDKKGIFARVLTVPDSESSKSYRVFSGLTSKIAALDKGVRPFIIAFGGGVIGDLAGFAAAAYRRGVPLVEIPTTLLAQVDSSIGGKVAIDLPAAKNMVGAFYQPRIVISDTALLKTLPAREIKCGLSEIIKYSVIDSGSFFDFLARNMGRLKKLRAKELEYVIQKCSSIKAGIVSADEKDTKGIRAVLNYGHTIGHAIEAASGYTGPYSHGEAVSVGMIAAAVISSKMGLLKTGDLKRIKALLIKAGLPVGARGLKPERMLEAVFHDKKFTRGVNMFILPVKIGKVRIIRNVPKKIIIEAVKEITRRGPAR